MPREIAIDLGCLKGNRLTFFAVSPSPASLPALSMSTLIWWYVRRFLKMDAEEAPERSHVSGGFIAFLLFILAISKLTRNNGYSWNLGGMFIQILLLHVSHIIVLIRFCVKQCKHALSLSLLSSKDSTQIGAEYEHSPLVLMQGLRFTFRSIYAGG